MENSQIANIFDEIGDLLELRNDNQFRIRSYRTAAQSIRNLSDTLEEMVERGEDISKIPAVGKATADKIHEILETNTCKRLETLRKKTPSGVVELMNVPGIGPRKAMQINKALKINSLDELKRACKEHKVRKLRGMGEKTEKKILKGIATKQKTAGRILYYEADEQLRSIAKHLNEIAEIDRWEVGGSFRRGLETIGDLDILIHASNRKAAAESILKTDSVAEVISRGEERISVRLKGGLQVDLRYFDSRTFGSAWMYFTGSKAHNIKLRSIARDKGWKLNEYGLFKKEHRLAGKTEKSVYSRLDMRWVPPELREDRGEVEAAAAGRLPHLIDMDDIHGDFQCHTTASDGKHSIKQMAQAAQQNGSRFLAITDHSKRITMANGLDDDQALKHADAIRKVDADMKNFWLLAGIEVDILKSGKLDLKEKTLKEMDWVVASVHYNRSLSRKDMTERLVRAVKSGVVHCIGHPLGRMIGKRDPLPVDMDKLCAACVEHNVRLEINCQPDRLDLPDHYCRNAAEAGVGFTLGTDAHSVDGLKLMSLGVIVARRAWLRRRDVLNTKNITNLRKLLQQH